MDIAIIGPGKMGGNMAQHMLRRGYRIVELDRLAGTRWMKEE